MEIFLLAAITSFLLTSAVTSFEQPENVRTQTVAYYFGGIIALGVVMLVVLVGPKSPEEWASFATAMKLSVVRAAAISLMLGLFTGVCIFLGRERRAAGQPSWLTLLLVANTVHLILALWILKLPEFFGSVSIWILATIGGWLITTVLWPANQPRNMKTSSLYVLGTLSLFAAMM